MSDEERNKVSDPAAMKALGKAYPGTAPVGMKTETRKEKREDNTRKGSSR